MRKLFILVLISLSAAFAAFWWHGGFSKSAVPTPTPHENFNNNPPPPSGASLPAEINLAIPFTSQAPHKVWDADHEEFCEEASVLMAASFFNSKTIPDPDFAESRLQEIKDFEIFRFGYFKDTTAAETVAILKEYYGLKDVAIVSNPTIDQIKQSLAAGKVIIEPAAGRQLGNPNFSGAGPLYHMLVIKGYTKDGKIITNDPGTRKGADYIYEPNVLLNAMHDWNGGDVDHGAKVMIVVG